MNIEIKKISAAETRPLREKILRPGSPLDKLVYTGDDYPESYHVGAVLEDKIVGIASVYRKSQEDENRKDSWQLRGMAVENDLRGKNVGKLLLSNCIEYIKSHGDSHLWCNARVKAAGFYQSMGFRITSEEFEIPDIGPHYIMEIDL